LDDVIPITEHIQPALASTPLVNRVSILIPAYNEEAAIAGVLENLLAAPRLAECEIIVINDGSSDHTAAVVRRFSRVVLINQAANRGYGASLVTGIKQAKGDYVVWFDADGQHRIEDLLLVIDTLLRDHLDYCIGVRDARSHRATRRMFGKTLLKYTVEIAAGRRVQDYNSGLRGFKREVITRYLHLLPKGFSASTTTTLIMYERGYIGSEVPIVVHERIGSSTVNQLRDGTRTLMTILRIMLMFKPLRFFGTLGFLFILVGSIYGFAEAVTVRAGFPVFGALLVILGLQTLFFGLLADQISQMRQERLS
jgi:glycosyltransferase involved in cell wall biosynthesis